MRPAALLCAVLLASAAAASESVLDMDEKVGQATVQSPVVAQVTASFQQKGGQEEDQEEEGSGQLMDDQLFSAISATKGVLKSPAGEVSQQTEEAVTPALETAKLPESATETAVRTSLAPARGSSSSVPFSLRTITQDPCVALDCPTGKECRLVRGKAYCVTKRTCADIRCRYDQECKMNRGSPRCSKLSSCSKVVCNEEQDCKVLGGLARCIKRLTCEDLTCGYGEVCIVENRSASCQLTSACRSLHCTGAEECRVVRGENKCVKKKVTCEDVRCATGQTCRVYAGSAKCVTETTCENTKCRYDHKCRIRNGLVGCIPTHGVLCGGRRCRPGFQCVTDDGIERCATKLTCRGVTCKTGQVCRLERNGVPRCQATCDNVICSEDANCEIRLGRGVCIECDMRCPRRQICRLIEPNLVSDLFVAAPKEPRCVPISSDKDE